MQGLREGPAGQRIPESDGHQPEHLPELPNETDAGVAGTDGGVHLPAV